MGGCTITRVADTLDQLFSFMEKQIIAAVDSGLYPDSELIVIEHGKDEASIYEVTLNYGDSPPHSGPVSVVFGGVKKGRYFHVGIAGMFGPKPKEGQLIGTIHVHS